MFELVETNLFSDWLAGLRDGKARARIEVALGNPGDVKPVGAGVSEMRIDYGTRLQGVLLPARSTRDSVARRWRQESAKEGYRHGNRVGGKVTMAKLKTRPYDTANYLKTEEDIANYLEAVFENDDPALVAHALGVVARVKGMGKIAKKAGLGRESLYKALSKDGNPKIETVLKVVHALGIKMKFAA